MKKINLSHESYQYMKKLNIQIVKEGKRNSDLENSKIELLKRDLNIKSLEGLINIFTKDLLVKKSKNDKLKEEIEDLKNAKNRYFQLIFVLEEIINFKKIFLNNK